MRWRLIFNEFLKKDFFKNKKLLFLLFVLIFGIAVLAFSSSSSQSEPVDDSDSLMEYKAQLEAELSDMCSSVAGVGKCRVMLTFERGAENTYKGSNLIESKPPRVMGVSIVCKGADSDEVRAKLVEMMTALFDIGTNRVSVSKLNS